LAIILNPNGRIAGQSSTPAAIPGSILARMRGVAQPVGTRPETAADPHEYAFLIGSLLDPATLQQAEREAVLSGVTTHAVLIASGCISQPGYTAALAQALGLEAALWGMVIDGSSTVLEEAAAVDGLPALVRGRACRVLSATSAAPAEIARHAARLRGQGHAVVLAPQTTIDAAIEAHSRSEGITHAVRGLLSERPTISAGARTWTWQIVFAAGVLGATIGGVVVVPDATIAALTGLIALPFLCVTLLRLVALRQILSPSKPAAHNSHADVPRLSDDSLPVYTVLVPLLLDVPVVEDSAGFAAGPFLLPVSPLTPGPQLCGEGGLLSVELSAAIAETAAKRAANAVAARSVFMGFHPL